MARSLFSYVVRYDSGFAPNPFFGYCTLATCKPNIRERAQVNDWLMGTGSDASPVKRGGYLVYAMRVTDVLSTTDYWHDDRFENKKPDLYHNWVSASGDNIYEPIGPSHWRQLDSYHSQDNGHPNDHHVARDTKIERILISDDFAYFGGEGPKLPKRFVDGGVRNVLRPGRFYRRVREEETIRDFEAWFRSLDAKGFQGKPWDWLQRRK